jgi:ribonuclease HI
VQLYCGGHNHEDVKMTLFVYSLEGDALEWFTDFPAAKFSTLEEILDEFRKRWGDQKEHRFQLAALTTIQKKENETVVEFNTKFNNLVKGLHRDIKPSDAAILIYYIDAFEGEMRYALRDKEPQDLQTAQRIAMRVEQNLLESRKSNIPGFNRGSSSKVSEEKKKETKGQESSSDGIDKLTQLIKQMEVNHANQIKQMEANHTSQMNAMQNRLIAMERSQANRPPHRPNDKWPRRPPQNDQRPPQPDQRPPNPFESTNLVEHQSIPYCRPCGEFHEESTCPVFLEDCYGDYGNEQINMCGRNYYGGMYDWMDSYDYGSYGNYMSGNVDRATEKYGPKPTPQQIAEMAKYKGYTYQRSGNKDKGQTSAPKVPPTSPKSSEPINVDLNIDLGGWLNNAKILVPVSEIMKIPSQREKLLKAMNEPAKSIIQKQPAVTYQDAPVILQNWDRTNEKNLPFYLSLLVSDKVLHNCMLDSGASSNVMTKKVMEQLNLRISRPYHNICALDSQTIEVFGLIKGLQVYLKAFPDIMIEMDIVVIDVPDVWGMLINRKSAADLGGNIQMDLSYATLPTPSGGTFKLDREPYRKVHVEDSKNLMDELAYEDEGLGNYAILSNSIVPLQDKVKDNELDKVWYMHFDGAFSRLGKGAGIVLQAPSGKVSKFAYRLEFDATNNVAEYEALILGLELCKDRGVKCLNIKGDSDLVIQQLKNKFACKSERLKGYRNTIWAMIEDLDALNLTAIPREQNSQADELAVAASTLSLPDSLIDENISVEVIFRPSVPDNKNHWQVFEDDKQVIKFLTHMHEFSDFDINTVNKGCNYTENIDDVKTPPRRVISLERNFDKLDGHKQREGSKKELCDHIEVNIGTDEEPRMVKIGKTTPIEERVELIKLLKEYRDVLAFSYDELKVYREDVIQHVIPLKEETKPFRQKLRQINPKLAPLVQQELQKMLEAGIIAQTRHSSWCSNLVVARKKNGKIRICIDFRNLNRACTKDHYPLPKMETLLQRVTGSGMISMLDGFSGYNQIRLRAEDRHKTTFTTPWGTFEYLRMPFGLSNAGATFQRAMDYAFRGLIGKLIEIYQDDLTVFSKDGKTHINHLRQVLDRCREFGISLNPAKSVFGVTEGKLLGHIISKDGVKLDPERVEAIKAVPLPHTKKSLQSFLGQTNFVHRFIPNYAEIMKPIYKLLKKDVKFEWKEESKRAFETIKTAICEAPVLISPDYDKEFQIFSFASEDTIAGVLLQKNDQGHEQPIAYFSRALQNSELKYPMFEKQAYALVKSLKHFRVFIGYSKVIGYVPSPAVKDVLSQVEGIGSRGRWIAKIQEYDLEIRPTKLIKGQGLAKMLTESNERALDLVCQINDEDYHPNLQKLEQVEWYTDIIFYLKNLTCPSHLVGHKKRALRLKAAKYVLTRDGLGWKNPDGIILRCVDDVESKKLVDEFHGGFCGGHFAAKTTTHKILRAGYYWPTIFSDVHQFVRKCEPCQLFTGKQKLAALPLQPVVVEAPFQQWGLDFIGKFSDNSSNGYSWVLTATDYFTKWVEAIPTKSATEKVVMDFLEDKIITRFGVPSKIVTDNAKAFCSAEMTAFCFKYGIILSHASDYYPQGNGQAESSNKNLMTIVKKIVGENKRSWDSKIKHALWADRITKKAATGKSPFELVYGLEARLPIHLSLPTYGSVEDSSTGQDAFQNRVNQVIELDETRRKAFDQICRNQSKVKKAFDMSARQRDFIVGDTVLLWDKGREKPGKHGKFDSLWLGPYLIREIAGPNSFHLSHLDGEPINIPRNGQQLKLFFR